MASQGTACWADTCSSIHTSPGYQKTAHTNVYVTKGARSEPSDPLGVNFLYFGGNWAVARRAWCTTALLTSLSATSNVKLIVCPAGESY